jgi:hypothetical protein
VGLATGAGAWGRGGVRFFATRAAAGQAEPIHNLRRVVNRNLVRIHFAPLIRGKSADGFQFDVDVLAVEQYLGVDFTL